LPQLLQHLIRGLDGLGVQLVGALGLDHLTSSSTTLTLLASTKPCLMRASALLLGLPTCGAPLLAVSR
jgi:hypothetical protein